MYFCLLRVPLRYTPYNCAVIPRFISLCEVQLLPFADERVALTFAPQISFLQSGDNIYQNRRFYLLKVIKRFSVNWSNLLKKAKFFMTVDNAVK